MQIIKKILISTSLLANFAFVLSPALASAQIGELRCGVNSAATGEDCKPPENSPSLNTTISRVINVLSSLVAVVAVIMIMVGGFRYVTSGGDSNRTTAARNTIMNSIIGLVIAVSAQVIVRFVLHSV
jgi:magnesium-transporting ATPase (P-type)